MSASDLTVKLLVVGATCTGKTSLVQVAAGSGFRPSTKSTVGMDFHQLTAIVGGRTVNVQLWDTAGEERFSSLSKAYLRRGDGVLVVFDVTSRASLACVDGWLHELLEGDSAGARDGSAVFFALVGAKTDLPRDVSAEEGAAIADRFGVPYLETSAKLGHNVERLVELATAGALPHAEARTATSGPVHSLSQLPRAKTKRRGCC